MMAANIAAQQAKFRRIVWTGSIAAVTMMGAWYGAGLKTQVDNKNVCPSFLSALPLSPIAFTKHAMSLSFPLSTYTTHKCALSAQDRWSTIRTDKDVADDSTTTRSEYGRKTEGVGEAAGCFVGEEVCVGEEVGEVRCEDEGESEG